MNPNNSNNSIDRQHQEKPNIRLPTLVPSTIQQQAQNIEPLPTTLTIASSTSSAPPHGPPPQSASSTSMLSQLILQSSVHKRVKSKLKYVKNEQDKRMFQKIDFLEFPFYNASSNSSSISNVSIGNSNSSSSSTPPSIGSATVTPPPISTVTRSMAHAPSLPSLATSQRLQHPSSTTPTTPSTPLAQPSPTPSQLYKMKLSFILNPSEQ